MGASVGVVIRTRPRPLHGIPVCRSPCQQQQQQQQQQLVDRQTAASVLDGISNSVLTSPRTFIT